MAGHWAESKAVLLAAHWVAAKAYWKVVKWAGYSAVPTVARTVEYLEPSSAVWRVNQLAGSRAQRTVG